MIGVDPNRVELRSANGLIYTHWKEVTVRRGIEMAAGEFQFPATNRADLALRPETICQVRVGSDPLVTGYLDTVEVNYDGESMETAIAGRSRTKDAVDCSAVVESGKPGTWRNRTLEQIAEDLCEPYDIPVVCEVTTDPIRKHVLQRGETVFDSIERAARKLGVLVTDDTSGRLVLTRATELNRAVTPLVVIPGETNVLQGAWNFSGINLYTEYVCKGQSVGNDEDFGEMSAHASATITDSTVARRRVLVVHPEGRASRARCKDRARWEAATRAGQSAVGTYVVQGWRQASGALWEPNTLVSIWDEIADVQGEFLNSEVEYSLSEAAGMRVALRVMPPEAFELLGPDETRGLTGVAKKLTKKTGAWDELSAGVEEPSWWLQMGVPL